jgi:fucose permease
VNLVGLLLRLLPTIVSLLPIQGSTGRHLAVRLTLRAGILLAIISLASLAVMAAIAATIMGLAEAFGYPVALGISALILLTTAGVLLAALLVVDRRADRQTAATREASIGAAMEPLLATIRQIERKPLQSALLALAAGAVLGLLRRRR